MAYPVEFEGQNDVIGKPKGMTDEQCGALPVFRDGIECLSCWRLEDHELLAVNRTGCVFVGVFSGETQPPIRVLGASPNAEFTAPEAANLFDVGNLNVQVFFRTDNPTSLDQFNADKLLEKLTEVIKGFEPLS